MLYRVKKHTQRYRKGQEVSLSPGATQTKQLEARGFIEPVKPPAEKRETKPMQVEETKKPRKRKAAEVDNDAPSTDE